ncbi:uncharacterized protein LOC116607750 isoform X2 [Nematostella vectensis]|uniref:uncharacterized protein LOC116607750 isoform X2 n=1 Tax=Nematostella vectensis TaxID=45351 RepID=UPI002077025A|nr:uncharacterized protein LOC116607750 isoform X2 [Nematostella vectensis]
MFKSLFGRKRRSIAERDRNNVAPGSQEGNRLESLDFEQVLDAVLETADLSNPESYSTVCEVECLWVRYQELTSVDGGQNTGVNDNPPPGDDPFLKQVWKTLPRDDDGRVTFQAFYGVIRWWQTADLDTKLRGIFKLLNGEQSLDASTLLQIVKTLDSDLDEETAKRQAELLMSHLDNIQQGFIDEDQWTQAVRRLLPSEIHQLTEVNIIPTSYGNDRRAPPEPQQQSASSNRSPISEELLVTVSGLIGERDWKPLAVQLGICDDVIQAASLRYPNRSREQLYHVMRQWNAGPGASKQNLVNALKKCGFTETASSISQRQMSQQSVT